MCIYTYIELLFLILFFFEFFFGNKNSKLLVFYISSITVILLIGLRSSSVGFDTPHYVKMFLGENDEYGTLERPNEEIEHGIYYVAWIIRLISDEYWAWHMITGIITLSPFIFCVYKYSFVKVLPFFIFMAFNWSFLYINLTIMRQALSVGFFLWAVILFILSGYKHKYWLIILTLISFSLHRSIIIAFAFFFVLQYVKFERRTVVFILVISIFMGIMLERMLYDIVQIINIMTDSSATQRFAEYGRDAFSSNVNIGRLGPATIYVITLILCCHKEDLDDIRFKFLIMGCILYNLTASISVAMRLVYPLTFLGVTYVPATIRKNILSQLTIILILLFFFIGNIRKYDGRNDYDNTYPYSFVWE